MRRRPLALAVAIALVSGCATMPGKHDSCHKTVLGTCQGPDVTSTLFQVGGVLVIGGVAALVVAAMRPAPRGEPARDPMLVGRVRWQDAENAVPPVAVTLRGANGPVVQNATTDSDGYFAFLFPQKPGWYTVAVAAPVARGETTFWYQDHRPGEVELLVQPPPR